MQTKSIAKDCSVDAWTRDKLGVQAYLREDLSPGKSWGGAQFHKEVTSAHWEHCPSQENTCSLQQQQIPTEWSGMGLVIPN